MYTYFRALFRYLEQPAVCREGCREFRRSSSLDGWATSGDGSSKGGMRLKSEWERKDTREERDENEEKSWCLERGNPPGWPAILISVGSFALSRQSNRSEAVFNHSIADAPDPLPAMMAMPISRMWPDSTRALVVCLSFWRLDVSKNKRWINSRRFAVKAEISRY